MRERSRERVQERIYGTMNTVGVGNLIYGIISIIAGLSIGILSIINGARLLKSKSNILF